MNWKKTLLICLLILLAGGALTILIFSTEPTAARSGATQETAMLVEVTDVETGNFRPSIIATGTVIPSQDITLSPRVSGQVIERSSNFTPGSYVEEGETLLRIDPSDYRNALQQRRSELQQALSDLNIEMGQQEFAQKEYQDYQTISDSLSESNKALILRQPQLEAIRSRVEAARAAVEQAELDLQRTTVQAPFDAHILSRNVNIGSLVGTGDSLGRLVGLDTYWVEASVPQSKLRWLTFPDDGETGSEVRIRNRTAWDENEYRTGQLFRLVGALEDQTRMARVLIKVPDPMAYDEQNSGKPPLMVGSFVETTIGGSELENVTRISRDYVRSDQTVWVMQDQKLQIRDVDIIVSDEEYAYIREGLDENDRVVTTNLATVVEGAPLRLEGSETASTFEEANQSSSEGQN